MLRLTDAEVARIFALAEEIVAVRRALPEPPPWAARQQQTQEEAGRALRGDLEQHRGALVELALLLDQVIEEPINANPRSSVNTSGQSAA